jgi:hypothetical protein
MSIFMLIGIVRGRASTSWNRATAPATDLWDTELALEEERERLVSSFPIEASSVLWEEAEDELPFTAFIIKISLSNF